MTGWEYYAVVLLVDFGTFLIAAWGLNLEFGVAGVPNLAYIFLVAAGAYTYAITTLGPSSGNGGFQHYVIGAHLPYPVAILCAAAVSAVLGALVGITGLKRLRPDYQAMALLVVSITATTLVSAKTSLVNGSAGLALIPNPLHSIEPSKRGWAYVGMVFLICLLVFAVLRRFTDGPFGRLLRAMRDDEEAALAIGKNVVALRIAVQAVGGAMAGVSGALLAGFLGGWSPGAWLFIETMALLTAIIVGGIGNNWGVVLGTAIVPTLIVQGVQFLPDISSNPELIPQLGWIILGCLTIGFLFFRPAGVIPETGVRRRHRVIAEPAELAEQPADGAKNGASMSNWLIAPRGDADRRLADEREDILVVDDIHRDFGGVRAVDGATFSVQRGSITGLIGPNGAGKSTALGIVSGFVRAGRGTVRFDGADVTRAPNYRRARRGLVRTFQLSREFATLSTLENLVVAAPRARSESALGVLRGRRYWGAEEREITQRARRLLALFQMEDKAAERAGNLSGGQKRMLEVMRGVMTQPSLLLLDEPTAGLSPRLTQRLGDACLALREEGLSILLVEHELETVDRLCDTVIVMVQGKVFARGSMADLRTRKEVQEAYLVG
ncbi:MAG: branched-chain amino acid ABC transporter ATP-binding protein/permease [Actinobacteria bacterium]|nr:branched-chain amino acid ABC transporter ATP-binding protein/permease [Actinomycetota bacterium]